MKKLLLISLCLLLIEAVPALAEDTAPTTDAAKKFVRMDADKNGKVTWEEFRKTYPGLSQNVFDALDADRDGGISIEEWQRAAGRFLQMDTDGDGYASWEDFQRVFPKMQKGAFESIDTDKNGKISMEEWARFLEQHHKGMAPARGKAPEGKPMIMPPSR